MQSCRLFGISRQAFYQQRMRERQRAHTLKPVKAEIMRWRQLMPRLGTRKLYQRLKPYLLEQGIKLGRDALFTYLRQHNLLVSPVKNYRKTTNSHHRFKKHPNRLLNKVLQHKEEVFVSDITYLESDEGTHYLSLVTDAFSRPIMGYHVSNDMSAKSVAKALKQAIRERTSSGALIHHSDRGTQYCSDYYQGLLAKYHIFPSTTEGYDCYQNALAERVNGILKQEFLLYRCRNLADLKKLVGQSVQIYNHYRPHLSLDMKTPDEIHKKANYKWQLAF